MTGSYRPLVVSGVLGLTPYQPGKPIAELERELGIRNIVKLASNENPLGPSPKALAAVQAALADLALYPDGSGYELKHALAKKLALAPTQITLGNGSNDVLELIARVFLGPNLNAVYSEHAFAVYPLATQVTGAAGRVAAAGDGTNSPCYGHDLDAMLGLIDAQTRVVFVANPNNPTGTYLSAEVVRRFLERVPEHVIAVVDEAYFEYVDRADYPDTARWLADFPNLIVTRTFSKAYGLAGLRVGYALSSDAIADFLNRVRQPFNVNSLGLVAAAAALDDRAHLQSTRELNREQMALLEIAFQGRGLSFIPSVGNFVSVDVGSPASSVYDALLRRGVITRPIANYGLPNYLRVTVGTPEQNAVFLDALDVVLRA